MISPGATLGLLGGGQLGRMFTAAARRMGYEVVVLDPDPLSPAGTLANRQIQAPYRDENALRQIGEAAAAVTTEFENVPAASLEFLRRFCPVRPGPEAVALTQDRVTEKTFARDHGLGTAGFHPVSSANDLAAAYAAVGAPAVLKTSRLGYDGKGQALVNSLDELRRWFTEFGNQPCILERRVKLDTEVSVVLARSEDAATVTFPVAENRHVAGILETSVVPARINQALSDKAQKMAANLAQAMGYVGTMAVEFFVSDGELLVNEMAPRPHNSGHYTIDACVTDQFEQQVRALAGLPLGNPTLLSPVAMINLLGELWASGEPHWARALADPRVKLHLYGKKEPRPGRKMGHLTVLAKSPGEALEAALAAKARLTE
ncbi:MAG TPA: 5-(carboxyamino)imidazole ribonucleotide synthase [Gemmatimonadales bacterium]|nr:5-(carboxyamino)imidazole ribonucleotide synthase [Gemmatimonadales bacterium]